MLSLAACSGTDVGYPRVSEWTPSPSAGTPSSGGSELAAGTDGGGGAAPAAGGAAGASAGAPSPSGRAGAAATTGGANAAGGSPGNASGGANTAGANSGGASTAGAGPAASFTWPGAFDAAAAPTPADGHHNVGASCMSSVCHGSKVPFTYGGTVYQADGTTGAPNVQVGISDGVLTLTTYSASNGNIWLPSSAGSIDWTKAVIAIRSAKGERVKPATAPRGSGCNGTGCHNSAMRLVAP